MATGSHYGLFLSLLRQLALALIFSSTFPLPMFAASIAATLTARYARSPEYSLLCVTPLSDAGIVKGCMLAALRRCRALLTLMLGLTPVIEVLLAELVMIFAIRPFSSWTVYDGIVAQVDVGVWGIVLKHVLATIMLALGMLGVNLLAIVFGVLFGLWWHTSNLPASAAIISTWGTVVPIAYCLHRAVVSVRISDVFLHHILQYILFAPFPYLIALGCMRLAQRWARKPGCQSVPQE
ncbi:MAG: hypothetical protein JW918_15700 [Anaerolineae bacterium]|nr:hypothetical protein [Anaerolineae bacterium]